MPSQNSQGQRDISAIQEVEQEYKIPVAAIARLENLISYLENRNDAPHLASIQAYRAEYGVA